MAATRFYFPAEGSGTPSVSPPYSSAWEQTGQATRLKLLYKKNLSSLSTLANTGTRTVPITTTQDILCNQFVSDPIPPQRITGSFSIVIRALESASTANVNLAFILKVVSQDGQTTRGTLWDATAGVGTEFGTTASTRTTTGANITALTTQPGDRIVLEIGAHAAAPTAATTYTMRQGTSATSDFAFTSGLTTDLNPCCEFGQDLFGTVLNNYQFVKAGDGMWVGEKIR